MSVQFNPPAQGLNSNLYDLRFMATLRIEKQQCKV